MSDIEITAESITISGGETVSTGEYETYDYQLVIESRSSLRLSMNGLAQRVREVDSRIMFY